MPKIPEPDYKSFLVQRKFGLPSPETMRQISRAPTKYVGAGRTGASIPKDNTNAPSSNAGGQLNDFKEIIAKRRIEIDNYRAALDQLTDTELYALYREELEKKNAEDDQERFFSQPSAAADFDYWSKMAHWTLDEAVALSFGKSPKVVNKTRLSGVHSWTSPFVREYENISELARRAVVWKKLFDPVMPILFVKWAKDTDIPLPEELVEKVEARSGALLDWKELYDSLLEQKNEYVQTAQDTIAAKNAEIAALKLKSDEDKPLRTKERESLLKLVVGMAVDGYGFDTNAKRSPIPQQIADILAERGIPLDVDTVRKWLREAAEFLPGSLDDDAS